MPSRRTRRAPIVITAAAAVLLTGATAVLLLHGQLPNGRRRMVTTTLATSRSPRDRARTAPPAGPAGSPTVPAIDPAGLRWADFHGISLPVSAQHGPRDMRGGLASGFTDTPSGALLAAINIGVRTAAPWGPAIYAPTISRQVTGPDQATLLHDQAAAYYHLRASAHVPNGQPPAAATPSRPPTGSSPTPPPTPPSTSSPPGPAATEPPCWPRPGSKSSGAAATGGW